LIDANEVSSPVGQFADDELDQIIIAIDMKDAGTVGCAYYSAQEKKLYLLGDIQHSNTEIMDTCLLRIWFICVFANRPVASGSSNKANDTFDLASS
jgi:hypothetical protein